MNDEVLERIHELVGSTIQELGYSLHRDEKIGKMVPPETL